MSNYICEKKEDPGYQEGDILKYVYNSSARGLIYSFFKVVLRWENSKDKVIYFNYKYISGFFREHVLDNRLGNLRYATQCEKAIIKLEEKEGD